MSRVPHSSPLEFTRRSLLRSVGVGALALGALGVTAACSSRDVLDESEAGSTTSGPITIVDQYDNTVTFDSPIGRIATMIIPVPSMIIASDRSDSRIVGVNSSSISLAEKGMLGRMFPTFLDTPVVSGPDFVPNVERVLELNPDVVIQWGHMGDEIVAPLRAAGLKVVQLKYGTQEDLEAWIALFGTLLGKEAEADRVLESMSADRATVEQVAAASTAQPRTLYLYNAPETKVAGADSYMDFWIGLNGGTNVGLAAGSGSSIAVTKEQILQWDPEVLFLGNFDQVVPADIYADPAYASLSAVRERRVYKAPIGGFSWDPPCNESNLMWLWVSSVLHPGTDHDLRARIRTTYDQLYGYDVTDADIDDILHYDANSVSANYDLFRA
ncbi:MAG: ABC transporter substrate-binding protein [Rhodococcus sp. (in: high G+C Gram-positive bacteria)]|uniref:ABC transporter substrate-binding protein n=1 Tax=Rhodococcus sp. TaxID=1831 RepID=UPI003BB7D171